MDHQVFVCIVGETLDFGRLSLDITIGNVTKRILDMKRHYSLIGLNGLSGLNGFFALNGLNDGQYFYLGYQRPPNDYVILPECMSLANAKSYIVRVSYD